MNKIILTILCLAAVASVGFAQSKPKAEEVKRLTNETAKNFAKRNAPSQSELTGTVFETEAWGNKNTVVAFYSVETKGESGATFPQIVGYVFVPKITQIYEKRLLDFREIESLNPDTEFKAVFLANADKDKPQELIIIGSHGVHSPETMGTYYMTFIFDDIRSGTNPTKLSYLKAISEKVSGGCYCRDDDGKLGAKEYQTASQVRAGLKKLGF